MDQPLSKTYINHLKNPKQHDANQNQVIHKMITRIYDQEYNSVLTLKNL